MGRTQESALILSRDLVVGGGIFNFIFWAFSNMPDWHVVGIRAHIHGSGSRRKVP
jgi:hypothetical protein